RKIRGAARTKTQETKDCASSTKADQVSIHVEVNGYAPQVDTDLRTICGPGSDVYVDLLGFLVTEPDGGQYTSLPTGNVVFRNAMPSSAEVGYNVVRTLASMQGVEVRIIGQATSYQWGTQATDTLFASGGITSKQTRANTILIQIIYDATNCGTGIQDS